MKDDYHLNMWAGDFGKQYTERCDVDYQKRVPIFKKLLASLNIFSVLECGCNKGHNLEAIKSIDRNISVIGIEPQKALCRVPNIVNGNIYEIPFSDKVFDLVFTSGVLIHLPSERVEEALIEMNRVSKKYVMFVEYYNAQENGRTYRDFQDREGVWARPYGDIYQGLFEKDFLIRSGRIKEIGNDGWGFTDCNYWIFEKK